MERGNMTQHNDIVEEQRLLLKAEEWAKQVKGLHAHSLGSMWYDDTNNTESVLDVEYWSGLVIREYRDGTTRNFGEVLTGEALISEYTRNN